MAAPAGPEATPDTVWGTPLTRTPHRNNPAYQQLLDSSPQTYLEEITPAHRQKRRRELEKLPAIAERAGRPRERGLSSSQYARPGPLDHLISELGAVTRGITRLAKAIDDIIEDTEHGQKETLRKLFQKIPVYLSAAIKGDETGQSKTWATITDPPTQPITAPSAPPARTKIPGETEDLRILARIPETEQQWARSLRNFALRDAVCKATGLALTEIPAIHHTATGFAIRPSNKLARSKLQEKEEELKQCLRATAIELPVKWYNYVIPNCPTELPNIFNELASTEPLVRDEIISQTGHEPIRLHLSRHSAQNPDLRWKTWIVSFLEPVNPFRLFNASAPSKQTKKKHSVQRHNPGCQAYHSGRYCPRPQRCENCGTTTEDGQPHTEPCNKPSRCANCHGPYPAGHVDCPARPIIKDDVVTPLTTKELKAVRQIGHKSYLWANPTTSQVNQDTISIATRRQHNTQINTSRPAQNDTDMIVTVESDSEQEGDHPNRNRPIEDTMDHQSNQQDLPMDDIAHQPQQPEGQHNSQLEVQLNGTATQDTVTVQLEQLEPQEQMIQDEPPPARQRRTRNQPRVNYQELLHQPY
jgi:hypothetical protein